MANLTYFDENGHTQLVDQKTPRINVGTNGIAQGMVLGKSDLDIGVWLIIDIAGQLHIKGVDKRPSIVIGRVTLNLLQDVINARNVIIFVSNLLMRLDITVFSSFFSRGVAANVCLF